MDHTKTFFTSLFVGFWAMVAALAVWPIGIPGAFIVGALVGALCYGCCLERGR